RKGNAFIQQQRLNPTFAGSQLPHLRVAQLHQMTQLAITRWGHMNAAQLSTPQSLRQLEAVEAICFHSFPLHRRYHRGRDYQTRMARRRQLIVEPKAGRSRFVNKSHSLTRKMLPRVTKQLARTVGQPQRFSHYSMISKSDCHALLVDVQTAEDVIV